MRERQNSVFGLTTQKKRRASIPAYFSDDIISIEEEAKDFEHKQEHFYRDWDPIDISEYIGIMITNIECSDKKISPEAFRIVSDDKRSVYEYKKLIKPITDLIESKKIEALVIISDSGESFTKSEWDDGFISICKEKENEFINSGKFLSLFELSEVIEKIKNSSTEKIYNFISAIRTVYSFSNLADVFLEDSAIINSILGNIENEPEVLNPEKSRTKEIALVRLKDELKRYSDSLSA